MKPSLSIFLMGLISQCFIAVHIYGQTEIFVASTPCSVGTRPVPGIAKGASGCELIKWHLKFSGANSDKASGKYVLDCNYGMPKQGTRGFINGGTHLHGEGKWVIAKGRPANSSAVIYKLDPDKPGESISFIRLNENLLHLLDSQKQLMIGNGAWSYTFSRVKE